MATAAGSLPASSPTPPLPRPQQTAIIAGYLTGLTEPDSVFELFATGCHTLSFRRPHNRGGFFHASPQGIQAASEAAVNLTTAWGAKAVYWGLNPRSADLLSRRANRVDICDSEYVRAKDSDVTSRRWLLIDCDPTRTAGVSASKVECDAAREVAISIDGWLRNECGWPTGGTIAGLSGNGYHLLARINLPNDEASTTLVKSCLRALASRFSTEAVGIDTAVFDAARICKLYGTVSRKGDHTAERPWRASKIVSTLPASGIPIVSVDLLEQLARQAPMLPAGGAHSTAAARSPRIQSGSVIDRARKYLSQIDPAVSGQGGHDQAFHAAAELVTGFNLAVEDAWPLLLDWNETNQPPFSEQHLRHKLDDADKLPGIRGARLRPLHETLGRSDHGGNGHLLDTSPIAEIEMTETPGASFAAAPSAGTLLPPPAPQLPAARQKVERAGDPPASPMIVPAGPDPAEHPDDPHRLARIFIRSRYQSPSGEFLIRFYRDEFWRYSGHRWQELRATKEIRAELSAAIKAEADRLNVAMLSGPAAPGALPPVAFKVKSTLVSDVLQALQGYTLTPAHVQMPSWVPSPSSTAVDVPTAGQGDFVAMRNGILHLSGLIDGSASTLLPHSPSWFSPVVLPYDFDPDATCPRWMAFLDQTFMDHATGQPDIDRIALLQQWFGYNLLPDNSHQKFMVFEGSGSNGKSVVCAALLAILGSDNVSNVPLEQFVDKHSLYQTLGKLANISGDVGELDKAAEGTLKAFTAGDRMAFKQMYRAAISEIPTARLTMAMNNRPRFSDKTDGLFRRMLLIPFLNEVDERNKVRRMADPRWWEDAGELPGIFNWAIEGLRWLRDQDDFTRPLLCQEAIAEYRRQTDSAREFLETNWMFVPDPEVWVRVDIIYSEYLDWCRAEGERPVKKANFGKSVSATFKRSSKQRLNLDSERFHVYSGLKRHPDYVPEKQKPVTYVDGPDQF